MCHKASVLLPEPVPPLIRNASLASIMRASSFAAPGVTGPEATQSSGENLRCAGTRSEMQTPGDARGPNTAWTRLPSASLGSTKGIRIVQTCKFDIFPAVIFVTALSTRHVGILRAEGSTGHFAPTEESDDVWDVDESNAGSLVLLRRTLFKYKGVSNWMNFINEPYICGEPVEGAGTLLRASWTSKRYLGYARRTVRMEYRLTDGPDSAWDNRFLDSASTDDRGYVELFDILSGAEEGPGGVLPDDGPPCGGTIVFRGHYGGNSTSSGTWSNGDAIAEATIDWEKYRPHLKEEIDAAGMAKDCAKLDELGQEVASLPNWDEVLLTCVFRWGVQTGCWEDD